jgi:peptide chain release factor 2
MIGALCARIAAQLASDRIRALEERTSTLLLETAQPTFWDDQAHARLALSALYHLERLTDQLTALRERAEALREGLARLPHTRDVAPLERFDERRAALEQDLALAELELLASDPSGLATDTVVIAISPVATSSTAEPGDWPAVLHAMYRAWADAKGYEAETVHEDGAAELLLTVHGPSVAAMLQGEAGLHKRQTSTSRSPGARDARTAVQLARVEITPIPAPSAEPRRSQSDGIHLMYLDVQPPPADRGRDRTLVEAYHAASGTRLRFVSQDPSRFAAALLRARLDAAPASTHTDEIVRLYNLTRTQYVRDPRTGQRSDHPRAVLSGALDPFLLAYLTDRTRSDADPGA